MTVRDYAIPFHRSLLGRELYFGIPMIPLLILFLFTVIMVADFEQFVFIIVSIFLLLIMREITKKDEWLLDIVFTSLFQPDTLH